MTTVAAVQLAPVLGDPLGNRQRLLAAVDEALTSGADVIVLPELATSGYMFDSAEEAASLAITTEDPLFSACARRLAERNGAALVFGFAEAAVDGIFNSAAVVVADGVRGVYRKVHLWDREKYWFQPGTERPLVVPTVHGRIGVMVCFDLEFPEWSRIAALGGTDLLAVPTNWPAYPWPASERVAELQIAIATARTNRMAVAVADRSGPERGATWCEGTAVIGADGVLRSTAGPGTGTAWADIDLLASRDKRQSDLVDTFRDRRPDLYGPLLDPPR